MFDPLTNINQKNFLLILYVVALCVFAPGIYYVSNRNSPVDSDRDKLDSVEQRMSFGEKVLVTAHNNSAKQEAIKAYGDGDYAAAQEGFSFALKSDRNDPEALIYLNNTIAAKTKDSFRIAASVPIGGDLDVAQEILRGVAQAQDEVNRRGGINGRLMMVEITNDDNDPKIAQEIAKQLVADKKVLAVIGHNGSDASLAAAPVYQQGGMVMITPTSSAESLSTAGDHIFRTSPNTRDLAEPLADYAVNTLDKTKIAICSDSEAKASISFSDNFTWEVYNYGGKIIPIDCDLSGDLLPSQIPSKAVSQGADALLLNPSVRQVDQAVGIAAANNGRLTLLGNHSLNTYKTLKEGQDDVNGMVLAVAWYPPESANSFTQDAQKLWGGAVNWRTAMAYDATQSISEAIASGAERQKIQQALANPEFSARGATSNITLLPSGDRNLRGTLVQVQPGKKSGTGYDFVPLDKKLTTANTK